MCLLCPRKCVLRNRKQGFCRVRESRGGKLYTLVCAYGLDPMEKKPIFHLLPGTKALSTATAGCNLRCKFCQNWSISQFPPEETENTFLPPEKVVELAKKYNRPSIAYTYSEPTIFYEYMEDVAKLAQRRGLKNIYVTGTYINPEPLRKLCKVIDACNADLKGFSNSYLVSVCAKTLEPVLWALKILREEGVWLEVTNFLIPTLNDDMELIKNMARWLRNNLGPDVPLHFSRFWPAYRLKHLSPTPVSTLEKAREIALITGLRYVYIGNVPGHPGENTYCPRCKKMLIQRVGFVVKENKLRRGRCPWCGEPIPGRWEG